MRYAIIIEGVEGSYSAYVPDLPGCIAVGESIEETRQAMEEAIRFHIDGLREDNLDIPEPASLAEYVEV